MPERTPGLDLVAEWGFVEAPTHDINSRPIGLTVDAGSVRIAVDVDGTLHLLVPVAGSRPIPPDTRSRGVVVLAQELMLDGVTSRYVDLVCVDPSLRPVFIRLAGDVCERLIDESGDPVRTVLTTVDEWRDLFRPSREKVDVSTVEGLFGELLVVRELATSDPLTAVEPWVGPTSARHDFESPMADLEVKTALEHRTAVTIHGLDQLQPIDGRRLLLVLIHLRRDEHGSTVVDLVDELVQTGVPRVALHSRLAGVGYHETRAEPWQQQRWTHEATTLWEVGSDFPGVRRADLPDQRTRAIGRLSFELELSACGEPLPNADLSIIPDLLTHQPK